MTATIESNINAFVQEICASMSVREKVVNDFLKFIDCHPNLRGLVRVSENLIPLMEWLKSIVTTELQLHPVTLSQWQSVCRHIVDNRDMLSGLFSEIDITPDGRKHPFSKMIEKYPLYIALWFQYPELELTKSYQVLQANLLLTQFHFRKLTEENNKNYGSTTIASTRLIRQFADSHQHELRPLLEVISSEPQKMEDLLDDLSELRDQKAFESKENKTALEILCRMLFYASEHRGGYSRHFSRTWEAILNREAIRTPIIEKDPDSLLDEIKIERIQMPSQTKADEGRSKRAGCAVGEVKAGVEHFVYDVSDSNNKSQTAGRSPIAHIRRTKNKHHAVVMSNQILPHQWGRLSLYELAIFHDTLQRLFTDNNSRISCDFGEKVTNRELAILLTVMYWTSNELSTVIQYRFCEARKNLPKSLEKNKPNDFRFVYESEEWVHSSVRPSYKTPLKQKSKPFLNDTNNIIVLTIQSDISQILRQYVLASLDETNKIWRSKELFKGELEDYQQALSSFLKQLNTKFNLRLTQKRIADDLFYRLYQTSGDLVEAMLITGREHYLGMVPLHYSSPSLLRLQTVYTETCQLIEKIINQSLDKMAPSVLSNPKRLSAEQIRQKYAGGRHYLIKGAVTKLLNGENGLISRFNEALKFTGFSDYLVNLHNEYTLYVTEMLGFSTGYRAIRDPLDSLNQIDWQTGFACISDKDDLDYYNARLVWIPPLVLEQLRLYQQHSQLLAERLILINPELAINLLTHGEYSNSLPFLFLLEPNGDFLHLRPSEIQKKLQEIFPVPVNVNRSYLRNRLRELNCPGEMVNYFLGHWENGEEPFGLYSTLSPNAYKQAFAPLLEQLLKEDGWRLIEGFGRK